MFYDKFIELCNQREKSPSAVAEELGFQRATVTKWKKGSVPTDASLAKIAAYFAVPTAYFAATSSLEGAYIISADRKAKEEMMKDYSARELSQILDKKNKPTDDGELTEQDKIIFDLFHSLPEQERERALAVLRALADK